jgi:hypothetical protein
MLSCHGPVVLSSKHLTILASHVQQYPSIQSVVCTGQPSSLPSHAYARRHIPLSTAPFYSHIAVNYQVSLKHVAALESFHRIFTTTVLAIVMHGPYRVSISERATHDRFLARSRTIHDPATRIPAIFVKGTKFHVRTSARSRKGLLRCPAW